MVTKQEIINNAVNMVNSDITKPLCYESIKSLIDSIDLDGITTDQVADLQRLYAYFLPRVTRGKARNIYHWIGKAVSKQDVRPYFKFAYALDGVLYGCDGFRMHWCKTDRRDGYYHPASFDKIKRNHTYPDIKKVIGEYECEKMLKVDDLTLDITKETQRGKTVEIKVYLIDGYKFNAQYVNDALNGEDMLYCIKDNKMYLTSIDNKRHAIVMMRRD